MRLLAIAVLAAGMANAAILYSDLGAGGSVYDSSSLDGVVVKGAGLRGSSIVQAQAFTVSGSGDFLLSQIDVGLVYQLGSTTYQLGIRTDDSASPGATVLGSWDATTTTQLGNCCGLTTATGITGVTLMGGVSYFLTVGPAVLSGDNYGHWQDNAVGAALTSQFGSTDGGGSWTGEDLNAQLAADVLGDPVAPVPEPGSPLLLGCALLGVLAAARKRLYFSC